MSAPTDRDQVPGVKCSRSARGGVIIDLFAGPGGWSEGLRSLGLHDFGIEFDAAACATRYAAGHATWQADLRTVDPLMFRPLGIEGLIASPPCQSFSAAGKRKGLEDERGELVWLPMAWVQVLMPEWVAMEQVPEVLPIWKQTARVIEEYGYRTWTGVLNTADYGVPQSRERAILLAHRRRSVAPPAPTHTEKPLGEGLFGGDLQRWITMAEGLGWGATERPSPTISAGKTGDGRVYGSDGHGSAQTLIREREAGRWVQRERSGDRSEEGFDPHAIPCQTITSKARSWQVWPWERPATTVCGDPRLSPPGYRGKPTDYAQDGTYKGERSMDEAIRLSAEEALGAPVVPPRLPGPGVADQAVPADWQRHPARACNRDHRHPGRPAQRARFRRFSVEGGGGVMPPDSVAHRLSLRPEGRFTVLVCICGVEKVTAELHHDVAHLSLAYAAGMVTSPTLLRVVHDDPSFASDDLVAFEEEAVAAFVQFATAAGR